MRRKTHIQRSRAIKACLQCRSSKQGCDHEQPQCSRCRLRQLPCSYAEQSSPGESSTASTRSIEQTGMEDSLVPSPSSDASLSTLRIDHEDHHRSTRTLPNVHCVSDRRVRLVSVKIRSTKNLPMQVISKRLKQQKQTKAKSCHRCRLLKVRCDRGSPCARCKKQGLQTDCSYDFGRTRGDGKNSHALQWTHI
jgi:hypothetical protein